MNKVKERHIKDLAKKILSSFGINGPVNIFGLIANLGFRFEELALEKDVSGALIIKPSEKIICVRKEDRIERKRFSIAHELGHYYLHHVEELDLNKSATYLRSEVSSQGTDEKEIEANFFAACLLMPEEAIRELVQMNISFDENVEFLANHFEVSISAMAIRLSKLGYS